MFKKILLVCIPLMLVFAMLAVPVSADFPTPNITVAVPPVLVQGVGEVNLVGYTQLSNLEFYESEGTSLELEFTDSDNYIMCDGAYYVLKNFGFYENGNEWGWAINIGLSDQRYIRQYEPTSAVHDYALYIKDYPLALTNQGDYWSEGYAYNVATVVEAPSEPETIYSVWSKIMTWITSALTSVQAVFYANGSLTFIGTLSVIGVSIAIAWLLIAVLQRFLRLRG